MASKVVDYAFEKMLAALAFAGGGTPYTDASPGQAEYNWNLPPVEVVAPHDPVSMTRQEFAEECDINVLMAKYEKTLVWPGALVTTAPEYLDVSDVPDLMTAHLYLQNAEEAFMRLPASVRKEFDNDPFAFVEYASDPSNLEQLRTWGLAPPAPEAPPEPGGAINPVVGGSPTPPENGSPGGS